MIGVDHGHAGAHRVASRWGALDVLMTLLRLDIVELAAAALLIFCGIAILRDRARVTTQVVCLLGLALSLLALIRFPWAAKCLDSGSCDSLSTLTP